MPFDFILDEYPSEVIIDETAYKIETDFKRILSIMQFLSDDLFTEDEKLMNALHLFYTTQIPQDVHKAYREFISFISVYRENDERDKPHVKLLDYARDSGAIVAAFIQSYKIDLTEATMHWFKFCNLLENLSDGKPRLLNLIEIRDMKIDEKMDPKDRARLRKLKKEYSLEEKQDVSFADAFLFGAKGGTENEQV